MRIKSCCGYQTVFVLLILGIITLFSGCFFPGKNALKKQEDRAVYDLREKTEPVEVVKIKDYLIVKDDLERIPDIEIIDVQYYQSIPVKTFFLSLMKGKRNFVVDVADSVKITVPRWSGSFKGLLKAIQLTSGLFYYEISPGSYLVKDTAVCVVRLLYQGQDEKMKDLLLNTFDVEDVFIDTVSGQVVFNANSRQYLDIVNYFKKMPISFITVDVVILESQVQNIDKIGIDLTKLKAVIDNTLIPAFNVASDAVGFTVNLITGNINLTAVIQSIQSFSDTAVLQRSTLCSLSGREIILDVSTKVPYVDTISSSTGSTGAAVRGYTFKEETSGTTLKITAVSDTDIVSILSDIKFQEITDYLNVGSGADTISRPIVSVRNLKSLLSVVPGSVVKLASFRFVRSEKDKSGLYYWPVTLKGSDVKIFELTVLARVSVKKYVFE